MGGGATCAGIDPCQLWNLHSEMGYRTLRAMWQSPSSFMVRAIQESGGVGGRGACYGIVEGLHHERSSWEGSELGPSLSIGDCARSEFGLFQHRSECPLCVWELKAQMLGRVDS